MRVAVGIALLCSISLSLIALKKVKIDQVLAIIYHPGGPTLILQSHLRPDLADSVPTLKEAIVKELVLQRAQKLKIPLSEADKERHLARAQEQLGMTREELTKFFNERGLAFEEAREELGKNLLIEMTIDHVVRNKAYVSTREIEEYHLQNPVVFYDIKQSFVSYGPGSRSLQKTLLVRDVEESPQEVLKRYSWNAIPSIKGTDIAPERLHITTAEPGTIIVGSESSEGITLIQLIAKREIPLSERKQELSMLLGRDRYKKALDEFYESLLKEADPYIRYIKKEDKAAVQPASLS